MNPYTFYTYFSEMLPGDITNYLLPLRTIRRLSENPDLICDVSLSLHFLFTFFSLLNVLHFFLVKCKSGIKHNLQKKNSIFVHFFTLYDSGYLFYRFHKIICSIIIKNDCFPHRLHLIKAASSDLPSQLRTMHSHILYFLLYFLHVR